MKTMLEILKERLPDGLQITKVKDRPSYSQITIEFDYDGIKATGYLHKACAPGYEIIVCENTICAVMANVAIQTNNIKSAEEWLDRQQNLHSMFQCDVESET